MKVDTENIIHNRQRLRFLAIINLSLVFLYLGIREFFSQPHASWIHFLHFLVQPIVLIVSMLDNIYMTQYTLFLSVCIFLIDAFVCMLNAIAIGRCYGEPTAQCFDRIWESTVWIVLSIIFTVVDVLNGLQLFNLLKQVQQNKLNRI